MQNSECRHLDPKRGLQSLHSGFCVSDESTSKFDIYRSFGVPEIWRYDGIRVQIYELAGASYNEVEDSRFLPGLSCSILQEPLELSKSEGQTRALEVLRERLRRTR